ncbi:MAG TPA: preprotein translocase subunit YajC [Streptosporangiaceae bacterium]|jgi:preprotein translocase subunit YajC|nr:preprotein translocase subunit YajC [Streptosporangiaceae bacterium]
MGDMVYLAASTKSSSTNLLPILIIVVLFGILYMTMIRPQRNRQRQAQQMQSTVTPGARIRTTAGMYGTIKSIEDQDVVVEVAPGVNIRMLRRAVMDVVQDGGVNGAGPAQDPSADEKDSREPSDDWNPRDQKNV